MFCCLVSFTLCLQFRLCITDSFHVCAKTHCKLHPKLFCFAPLIRQVCCYGRQEARLIVPLNIIIKVLLIFFPLYCHVKVSLYIIKLLLGLNAYQFNSLRVYCSGYVLQKLLGKLDTADNCTKSIMVIKLLLRIVFKFLGLLYSIWRWIVSILYLFLCYEYFFV